MTDGMFFAFALISFSPGQDASRPLEVVSAADSRFSSRVELSVRFGKTLLVLECDGVEPMLYPLARQDLVHQGPRYVVQVGDKVTSTIARQWHGRRALEMAQNTNYSATGACEMF